MTNPTDPTAPTPIEAIRSIPGYVEHEYLSARDSDDDDTEIVLYYVWIREPKEEDA